MTKAREEKYGYAPTLNAMPEVQEMMNLPGKVELCDLTLDENGEGMAGVCMTEQEKMELARLLDDVGIQRIGVLGYPSPISKQEVDATKKITQMGLKAKTQALVSSKEDLDCAIEAGVWGATIRKPCSDMYTVQIDPIEKKINDFLKLANYAHQNGLSVGMMAQDVSRADPEITEQLIGSIHKEFGLDELLITDSQGLGNPFGLYFLVKRLKTIVSAPVSVHCHNMLGMGVANACAAVAAGAEIVHTTVHGLGHFAGMPPTEEVAVALLIGFGLDTGIQYDRLVELSKMVERFSGVKMQPHKAVVGELMFSRSEETKHIQELIDNREQGRLKEFFPYLPEFVGHSPRVVMAEKVKELAVSYNLNELGIKVDEPQLKEIHAQVKQKALHEERIITNDELREIAAQVIGK